MFRAICIHCMRPLWFNSSRERWVHGSFMAMCGNGETAQPIEMTITPKPELPSSYDRPVTPGLVP